MDGTVAITDHGWYEYLSSQGTLDEVNFWTPSAYWSFRGQVGSPFFFKLKARYNNDICGFAFFSRYARLPDWLAWESFQSKNGCPSFDEMRKKISGIRERIDYKENESSNEIGCILLAQPFFFPPDQWIKGPSDWPPANLRNKKYDITTGEGARIWTECLERSRIVSAPELTIAPAGIAEPEHRYGTPQLVQPRIGQGIFRVAVMDAYSRACAITHEHSLPALEASHIKPFSQDGPNEVSNGILLRADIHRLFDQGYITVTPDYSLEVSGRLKQDYSNGKTYYPMHGTKISVPQNNDERPHKTHIEWHNSHIYKG